MNKESSQKIQANFLLSDFTAIKAEISRRSDQQKTAYLLYLASISWIFLKVISGDLHFSYPLAAWFVVIITRMFIIREGLEIGRLGRIISLQICRELKKITDIDGRCLIPSENMDIKDETLVKRIILDRAFNFIVFFIIPIFISLYVFCTKYNLF